MSKNDTLFIAVDDKRVGLAAVARDVFVALGLSETEERDSSNYPPDDHYFVAYAANAVIKVCDFDDCKPGYPYCLSIDQPTYRKGKEQTADNATLVAAILAKAGFRIFVPIGPWYGKDWDGNGKEYAL